MEPESETASARALPGALGLPALLVERRPDGSPYLTRLRDDAWQRPVEYIQAVAGGELRWALRSPGPDGVPGVVGLSG